jgi:hypothetical protein
VKLLIDAHQRAEALDADLLSSVKNLKLENPKKLFLKIRGYLDEQCRNLGIENNIYEKIRFDPGQSGGMAAIFLGPSFDEGPSEGHIHFDSGSRLSFSIGIRNESTGAELVSFRFHLEFAEGKVPQYLRFDLNKEKHHQPLKEPRCHFHPGMENVRVPMPILHPIEVLDRIFFVIESELGSS